MSGPLLLDLSHTSHTRARTGIQRVARSLHTALGPRAVAITFDPWRPAWRLLERWEETNLSVTSGAGKRGARWPLAARLRGRLHRLTGRPIPPLPANSGLIVPEVFSPAVARALPELFAQTPGRRVAVFHDAIPLTHPEFTPAKTVSRFPGYLGELLAFDGIAAVSADSRDALIGYWRTHGLQDPPPVEVISLGVDLPLSPAGDAAPVSANPPVVLTVGSIEGRKNHLALLEACEQLWSGGRKFTVHLVGLANAETGGRALTRIRELQAAGRPLRYDGPVTEAALTDAYAACTFTVYPSLAEGFGLPVIESLAHAKPCICSSRGALGESARGGGCLTLDTMDAAHIAEAIGQLLADPTAVTTLAIAARQRRFQSWTDYARELTSWMQTIPRRAGG